MARLKDAEPDISHKERYVLIFLIVIRSVLLVVLEFKLTCSGTDSNSRRRTGKRQDRIQSGQLLDRVTFTYHNPEITTVVDIIPYPLAFCCDHCDQRLSIDCRCVAFPLTFSFKPHIILSTYLSLIIQTNHSHFSAHSYTIYAPSASYLSLQNG